MPRGLWLAALTSTLVGTLLVVPVGTAGAAAPLTTARTNGGAQHSLATSGWSTDDELRTGFIKGAAVADGNARFTTGATKINLHGRRHDAARWTSRWVTPGFAFTELVPSWQGRTPKGSSIRIRVRGRAADGRVSSWDKVALWAAKDTQVKRRSYAAQSDDLANLNVDTWRSNSSAGLVGYQLRVDLLRPTGTKARPRLDRIGAVASRLSTANSVAVSPVGSAAGVVLSVPTYSQMTHTGHYPQWGGGGEAWCSPTSVTMVLGYRGRLPGAALTSWVRAPHADAVVDHAARSTYDYAYPGAGNWPFNTAYAGTRGREAWVTRFRSLRELEPLILAGTPVIVSVRFGRGELAGAPISATNGHLMVVVGFDAAGNVVVNDPAAKSNSTVRRTYQRAQFENVWAPASPSGSGGLSYVIN